MGCRWSEVQILSPRPYSSSSETVLARRDGWFETDASGSLAQSVEQLAFNQLVAGSNPARPTIPSPSWFWRRFWALFGFCPHHCRCRCSACAGSLSRPAVITLIRSPSGHGGKRCPPRQVLLVQYPGCAQQRCQDAFRILLTAPLSPSWASEITSLTPRSPRRVKERRNSTQNVSASEAPTVMPRISLRPSPWTPTAMMTATEMMRPS